MSSRKALRRLHVFYFRGGDFGSRGLVNVFSRFDSLLQRIQRLLRRLSGGIRWMDAGCLMLILLDAIEQDDSGLNHQPSFAGGDHYGEYMRKAQSGCKTG